MTEKYEYCSTVPRTFVQDRRSIGFANWFVKIFKIHAKTVQKINWSVKTSP